jgi:hypothetical protein
VQEVLGNGHAPAAPLSPQIPAIAALWQNTCQQTLAEITFAHGSKMPTSLEHHLSIPNSSIKTPLLLTE